jgi:hypothetical protein
MVYESPFSYDAGFNHNPWEMDTKEEFRKAWLPHRGSAIFDNWSPEAPQHGSTFS